MNHLSDEQIVALLYSEPDCDRAAINEHLKNCSECQLRFEQFSDSRSELDLFVVSQPGCQIDTTAILSSDSSTIAAQVGAPVHSNRPPWAIAILASAALLAVGGFGFLFGMSYQTTHSASVIKEQVADVLRQVEQENQLSSQDSNEGMVIQIQKQLESLKNSLAEQNDQLANQNLVAMKNLGARFKQLLIEQSALREDLQTLAVNAENEISLTKEGVRQISEYVSAMLPISQ